MSTTSNWDSDTSTGGKGFSRYFVNDNSSWSRVSGMSVNVGGSWKVVRKAWVNVNGSWKPVMWHPKLNEVVQIRVDFLSREAKCAHATGSFKWVGGDILNANSWETRVETYQCDGPHSGDSGWVTGMATSQANQAQGKFIMPSASTYNTGGTYGSEFGACTPVLHGKGSHYSNRWHDRACYDNSDLTPSSYVSGNDAGPWGYTVW